MKLLVIILVSGVLIYVDSCNEAVCGSIVSKCLLTKACSCDLTTRVCSKDCFSCLGYMYTECCVCVDDEKEILRYSEEDPSMCMYPAKLSRLAGASQWSTICKVGCHPCLYTPIQGLDEGDPGNRAELCSNSDAENATFLTNMCPKDNATSNILSKKSHVEDYLETVPELFSVLTEYPDVLYRWNVSTYEVNIDISQYPSKNKVKIQSGNIRHKDSVTAMDNIVLNCTVVFWSQCMSWIKCKSSCLSMGSSSYRWFHDGCCECVGQHCINYGINESRCQLCPLPDNVTQIIDEGDLDFGEDDFIEDYEED